MTMTLNSGLAAYCTGEQFVTIFDFRTFAQLASDTDVALTSASALAASTVLTTKLRIAAGLIEMAATVGARYDPDDLALLIATTITNSGYALIDMNAALAAAEMFGRRFEGLPDEIKERIDRADKQLMALEDGHAIFGFIETQQAGILQDYKETAQDVQARNLPSFIAHNLFGRRANRRVPGNYDGNDRGWGD